MSCMAIVHSPMTRHWWVASAVGRPARYGGRSSKGRDEKKVRRNFGMRPGLSAQRLMQMAERFKCRY